MSARPSGTVTFLFTDIVGSTRLWEQMPKAMAPAVARHGELVAQGIDAHGGYVFKELGDAFCVAFSQASDAVLAAVAAQRLLLGEDWSAFGADFPGITARMAIHTGAADERGGDYFGPPLNRVARLLAAGHGGQVLLTQATEQLVHDPPPAGVTLLSLGERRLKDLQRSESVFQLVTDGLPTAFPRLNTLETHVNNLPVQLTSFVGRERELARLVSLLEDHRLVTISGPGGCGKTRLALQVAADLIDGFADGVWLVELAPIEDAELLMQTIATTLGLKEEPGRTLQNTVVDYLAQRQMLLVLDNCEHLLDACARCVGLLLSRSPNLRVVATSRSALGVAGEVVWPLNTFPLPPRVTGAAIDHGTLGQIAQNEAVRMFVDRATAAQPGFRLTEANAAVLVEVCRRLEGIPLALELCAARVKVLSVEQLAGRLDDRLRLLVGGSRTASARQQTLRAAIDWSYELLDDSERELFRRFAVFRGGATLEAIEAVLTADGDDPLLLLDLVGNLVDKSLIRVEEHGATNRYRMLETLRDYARERLEAAGEADALRRRLLRWAAQLAQAAEPALRGSDQSAWLARLEDEHDNLRAALEWAAASAGPAAAGSPPTASTDQSAADLADGLALAASLWPFWQLRGYLSEGRERLAAFQNLSGAAAHPALLARILNGAAVLATRQGDYAAAEAMFQQGLDLLRRSTGASTSAERSADEAGQRQDARPAGATANEPIEAELLTNLGTLYYEQSNFDAARETYDSALGAWRSLGDRWGVARALNNLGLVAMNAGEADAARTYYREAQGLLKALGDRLRLSIALSNLGILALHGGEFGEARSLFSEALAVQRDLGSTARIASSLNLLGLVAYYERDLSAAEQHYAESLAIRLALGDRLGEAVLLRDRARLELASGAPEVAAATIQACLAVHEHLGKNLSLPGALEGAAYVASNQGHAAPAARLLAAAEALRAEAGQPIEADARSEHDAVVNAVRAMLGQPAADEIWAAGRQMAWHAALAEALSYVASAPVNEPAR